MPDVLDILLKRLLLHLLIAVFGFAHQISFSPFWVRKQMDKINFPFHRKDAKDAEPLPSQGFAVRWSFSCISWWEYENDFV